MSDATALRDRWVQANEERNLEKLLSCWHPEVETVHMIRPDRSWRGIDVYRRAITRIWEGGEALKERHVASAVAGNIVFVETMTTHADGTVVPCLSIFEVEEGVIRRARIYTDVPSHDGLSMDAWVKELNG